MPIATIITKGFGSFGGEPYVVLRGFGVNATIAASWADVLTPVEQYNGAGIAAGGFNDILAVVDSYGSTAVFPHSLADVVTPVEDYSAGLTAAGGWVDVVVPSDSYSSSLSAVAGWIDHIVPVDDFNASATFSHSWQDAVTPTDAFAAVGSVIILGELVFISPDTRTVELLDTRAVQVAFSTRDFDVLPDDLAR